jgi:hypothetical protein
MSAYLTRPYSEKSFKARKPPINVGVLSSRPDLNIINVGVLDLAEGKEKGNN